MNDDGANAAGLAAKLEVLVGSAAGRRGKLLGFVVFLNGNPEQLKKLAEEQRIERIDVAYLQEGRDFSPKHRNVFELYRIDPAARNTVIVYKDGKVAANFVNLDAADFGKVEAAVSRLLKPTGSGG